MQKIQALLKETKVHPKKSLVSVLHQAIQLESKFTPWKVEKSKINQNTYQIWLVNFGLCWKVTCTQI